MTRSLIRIGALLGALALAMPSAQAGNPFDLFPSHSFLDGPSRLCLVGNGAIRRAIERQGYTHVYLNVQNNNYIQSRATKGRWVYLLDVNACTGRVLDRQRLRPA